MPSVPRLTRNSIGNHESSRLPRYVPSIFQGTVTVPTPSCVVAPAELEGHLLGHPDVGDVCVVGIPDDYSGEVPLAFVVPSHAAQERIKTDPSESDKAKASIIQVSTQSFQCLTQIVLNFPWQFVHDHKVHYKRLAGGVEFVDIIPKNPSGKLLRRFLREKAKEIAAKRPAKAKL